MTESVAVLDIFVEAGGRSIDTADVYSAWVPGNSGADSETSIGQWLAARCRRDDVVIATRGCALESRLRLSAANICAAVDESPRPLHTDSIDLYYAHRDDDVIAQDEYVAAFGALAAEGKVREVGASNVMAESWVLSSRRWSSSASSSFRTRRSRADS